MKPLRAQVERLSNAVASAIAYRDVALSVEASLEELLEEINAYPDADYALALARALLGAQTEVKRAAAHDLLARLPDRLGGNSAATPYVLSERYVVLGTIGAGTHGEVVDGIDVHNDNKSVAIKVVLAATGMPALKSADRDQQALRRLCHRAIPKYLDSFEVEGKFCTVMERVEGVSIAELLRNRHGFHQGDVVDFLCQIASVLDCMHKVGLFHRDIAPQNVLLRTDGTYALVDFGAAVTPEQPGGSTCFGSQGCVAPEVFLQGTVLPEGDVYSMAATALLMLSRREADDLPLVNHSRIDVDAALSGMDAAEPLKAALRRMLGPDPGSRIRAADRGLPLGQVMKRLEAEIANHSNGDLVLERTGGLEPTYRTEREGTRLAAQEWRAARWFPLQLMSVKRARELCTEFVLHSPVRKLPPRRTAKLARRAGLYRCQQTLRSAVDGGNAREVAKLDPFGISEPFEGETILGAAVEKRDVRVVRALLKRGADPNGTHLKSEQPVLCLAAAQGDVASAEELVTYGASVNATNKDGNSPFWVALATYLILPSPAYFSSSPEDLEAKHSHIRVARFLHEMDDNVIDSKNGDGVTPLIAAGTRGDTSLVMWLLSRGADPRVPDDRGRRPLERADRRARGLLESGLQCYTKFSQGAELIMRGDPLHNDLLDGPHLALRSKRGATLLMFAARYNNPEAARQLLARKETSVDAVKNDRWSALMLAARFGHDGVVQLLVDADADRENSDRSGRTALMYAAQYGHEAIVQLLVDHGALARAKDCHGRTAEDYAKSNSHPRIARLLREKAGR